mmetsp:Transcript_16728/g.32675  ORF Transcript_16728/g.32675 Transcript_16728/m.32675 type:complete len:204 (+) Transcript_16728:880-1491(+)
MRCYPRMMDYAPYPVYYGSPLVDSSQARTFPGDYYYSSYHRPECPLHKCTRKRRRKAKAGRTVNRRSVQPEKYNEISNLPNGIWSAQAHESPEPTYGGQGMSTVEAAADYWSPVSPFGSNGEYMQVRAHPGMNAASPPDFKNYSQTSNSIQHTFTMETKTLTQVTATHSINYGNRVGLTEAGTTTTIENKVLDHTAKTGPSPG